jgi:hypothetical protein
MPDQPTSTPFARFWPLLAAVSVGLSGCGSASTASNLAPATLSPGPSAAAPLVKVAETPTVTADDKAKEKSKGFGGFGGSKTKAPEESLTTRLLPQIGPKVKARAPGEAYQLTADELKLDCKRINGKMQVRILQIRDQRERTLTSGTAQVIQRTIVPVLGGSPYGARPEDDFARDRAWLEAFNAQLAAKNCATYNLDNELQPRSIRDTPTPVPKPDAAKPDGKSKPKS